ncbi:MAG: glycosyltransferase family 4 protein [Thaumarchaeota archaeon]|nr:glycosyltransferase family 4 protein [Nitrososphaerota archaeon]
MTAGTTMRILMGVDTLKIFHVREFAAALTKIGAECRVVVDSEVYDGFPSRRISSWFQTARRANALFDEFRPDVVFVDRNGHFAKAALDRGLPLLVHLRGDYWSEVQWYKETVGRNPVRRVARHLKGTMEENCFRNAAMILPICNYLGDIVRSRYPDKPAPVMYQGIDSSRWTVDGANAEKKRGEGRSMDLEHPCVGLLQSANIWGKAREMLSLPKAMAKMPDVNFYWAGDGPYRDKILAALSKHDNFRWLGNLDYPESVRRYLAEIDVYALISGIDMAPLTLQEAQLMQRPVLATNVGGISEIMRDGTTGILVERQSPELIAAGIDELLNDEKRSGEMGRNGRRFVEENFNWDRIAADFVQSIEPAMT